MLGIYDSGAGGIYFAQHLHERIPQLDITVLADREHLPLGDKSPQHITTIVIEGIQKLFKEGCKIVLLVCNTASVTTIRYIQQKWLPSHYPDHNVLGITRPLLELIYQKAPKQSHVLLLMTQATEASGFYQNELALEGYTAVSTLSAPGLADMVEQGGESTLQFLIQFCNQNNKIFLSSRYIALACTHYSQFVPQILTQLYPHLIILDPLNTWINATQHYISKHLSYAFTYNSHFSIIDTLQKNNPYNIYKP